MDSYVPLGEVMYFHAAISDATTSAPSDASANPTWVLYEENSTAAAVSSGTMLKVGAVTGFYWGSATIAAGSGFEVGKWYGLLAAATAGTAGHAILGRFRVSSAESTVGAPNVYVQAGTAVASSLLDVGTLDDGTFAVSTVTNAIGTVSTVLVVLGTPAVNMVEILGTTVVGTSGTLTNIGTAGTVLGTITASGTVTASTLLDAGTPAVNLVQILGTTVVGTSGTLTNIGTAGTVLGTITASGTVTASTVLSTVVANVTEWKGTAVPGTQGTPIAVASTLTNIGNISTLASSTFDANVILWKGTAAAGTEGTPIARASTLTNIGAISTLASGTFDSNLVTVNGTAINNPVSGRIDATGTVTVTGTPAVNVEQWKATAVPGTQGTPQVRVPALESNRSTLTTMTADNTNPLGQLDLIYQVTIGQVTQDATTQKFFNPGGTQFATSTVSDDGSTFTRGKME